jgi:DNA-directed RNA polymerase subunit M/transcription elongation factor TFIIS
MPTLSTVLLSIKGEIKKASLQLTDDNDLTIEAIQKYFKKKELPEHICCYENENDNKNIFIFGYKKGKKGTENKTQLPVPNENIVMYGDSIIVVSVSDKWEQPIPYTTDQWVKFVNSIIDTDNCVTNDINKSEKTTTRKNNKLLKSSNNKISTKITTTKDNDKNISNKNTQNTIIDTSEDEEENDESESEDETDILSEAGSGKSVKDDYEDSESEDELLPDNDEEDEDEVVDDIISEPDIIKKRKTVINTKIDNNIYKENILRDSKSDDISIRQLCIKSLSFIKDYKFTDTDINSLEQAIYETAFDNAHKHYVACNWKSPQFCELYRQIIRNILSNIHPNSPVNNTRLVKRIMEGEFNITELPKMTSYEMFPEKWFELRDKQILREQKILEGNKSRATDQFKCRRCNKRECTYYEMQTRSADEPMTIFITCLNCGKEWRQGG